MKYFWILIILFIPKIAFAGGRSENIVITSFDKSNVYEAKLTIESERGFFGCYQAKLFLYFKPNYIFKTSIDKFISKENQIKSLGLLEVAWAKNETIKLGSMGSGFKIKDPCIFKSKGLAMLKEYDGASVIYSFYNPI